jgi:hypothetical protein
MDGTQHVKSDEAEHADLVTWLRDEEAAGSNPATPTTKLHVAARFRKQCRCLARASFWERTPADLMVPTLLTSSNAPCLCRRGGSGLMPLPR